MKIKVTAVADGIETSFTVPGGQTLASDIANRTVQRGSLCVAEPFTYVYNPYGLGIAFGHIEITSTDDVG